MKTIKKPALINLDDQEAVQVGTNGQLVRWSRRYAEEGNTLLSGREFDQVVARAEWEAKRSIAPKAPPSIECGDWITYEPDGSVVCSSITVPLAKLKLIQRVSKAARAKRKAK